MRGFLILILAAGLVAAGVLALSVMILPDAQPQAAAPDVAEDNTADSLGPPTSPGHHLEVTGDRTDTLTGETDADLRITLGGNLDEGLYVDSMVYDGLNIFLDPDECPLVHEATSLVHGLSRLSFDCTGLSDVHGNNTIDMEGWINRSTFETLPAGSEGTGGTLTVSGDVETQIEAPTLAWYVSSTGIRQAAALVQGPRDPEFRLDVFFEINSEGDFTLSWFHAGARGAPFYPEPGDCSSEATVVDEIDENTERVELTIDCPEVTKEDFSETASVSGTVLVDRITIETDDVPPEGDGTSGS